MKHIFSILSLLIGLAMLIGCGHKDPSHAEAEQGHDHVCGMAVTEWQDSLELFAEWPHFVAGESSEAVLHFTDLRTFEPATDGPLTVNWKRNNQVIKSDRADRVARTGIFLMSLTPPPSGSYDLEFVLAGRDMAGTVVVFDVTVYPNEAAVPHEEEAEHPDEISFLKEQQWKLKTKTVVVERRMLHDNLRAPGELKPAGDRASEVFAPFAGVLMPDPSSGAVRHGQQVTKDQPLAMIAPSPSAENSWYELVSQYRLAKLEQERVTKLAAEGAVSNRRLEEARQSLLARQAQLQAALGGGELSDLDLENSRFIVRAPRTGVIAHHLITYSSFVPAGEALFRVVDPSVVWLEIYVAAADAPKVRNVSQAYFTVSGSERLYSTAELGGKVVAAGSVLDPETRRLPVIFELPNPDLQLSPGTVVQVHLRTQSGREAMAIPRSAIVDDDGTPAAFVQVSGETFARRLLKTGIVDGDYVEVLSGLTEGERVVSEGAYKVKLASLGASDAIGHGHAH